MQEALCWGAACGAATASLEGTRVGDRRLVEKLCQQIEVEPISA
jgi:fructose-1-phosphate kinase PfkB-like protein